MSTTVCIAHVDGKPCARIIYTVRIHLTYTGLPQSFLHPFNVYVSQVFIQFYKRAYFNHMLYIQNILHQLFFAITHTILALLVMRNYMGAAVAKNQYQ